MHHRLKICAGLLSLVISGGAASAAEFSCDIAKKGRTVTLTQTGKQVSYAYGKKNTAPELALTVPLSSVELYAWDGFGRHHTHSIGVPNGQYLYTVYTSLDTMEQKISTGIAIEKNGEFITDLQCDPKTIRGDLEQMVLDLKPSSTPSN